VLQEFSDLTTFTISQIKKAISQSSLSMFVKPGPEQAASNIMDGVAHTLGAGPTSADPLNPEAVDAQGSDLPASVSYNLLPEATMVQPGSVGVFNLERAEDLKPFPQTAPGESYPEFVNAFVSYLSASTGMPVEVLLMKFGQNYSASRGALMLFWRVAMIWRAELSSDFLDPVFEEWLTGEIAAGRIQAPGWSDPFLRRAWLNHTWIGQPMPNIDPLRTAKADETYAGLGAQTLDHIARNLNGSDGSTNRAKLTRELTELPDMPWRNQGNNSSSSGEQGSAEND
jgi:capsid protein